MNRFKKFTSLFDREKLNLYKRFLKKAPIAPESSESKAPDPKLAETKIPDPPLDTPIDITQKPAVSKPKFLIKSGPHLYVSQILLSKGPLTGTEIWNEYIKDPSAVDQNLLKSKTFLRQRVLKSMKAQGKIQKAGYSPVAHKYLGYSLIPEKAFRRTDSQVLLNLQPKPLIKRMKKVEAMEIIRKEEKTAE